MRKFLFIFLLMFFTCGAAPIPHSSIQSTPATIKVEQFQIELWPEYDRPETLVIYRLTLNPQTSLPAQISLRIPKQVSRPSSIAMKDVDGLLYNLEYSLLPEGDWLRVSFTTPSLDVQIEYYDSSLNRSQLNRSFEYRWPGDFQINSLSIQVQQPINAKNMKIVPDMGSGVNGQDGLTYYTLLVGSINNNQSFTVRFNYDKSDDTLSQPSRQGQQVQPVEPITTPVANGRSFSEVLPWLLAGLGALLIAVGGYIYWQSSRSTPPTRQRHAKTKEGPAESTAIVYCHECGRKSTAGDMYCRGCGTKLRLE
jgi:hypothetical protein